MHCDTTEAESRANVAGEGSMYEPRERNLSVRSPVGPIRLSMRPPNRQLPKPRGPPEPFGKCDAACSVIMANVCLGARRCGRDSEFAGAQLGAGVGVLWLTASPIGETTAHAAAGCA